MFFLKIPFSFLQLEASLPVMVYIHGGGFYSHSAEEFPPNYLMERDIVLVVIQYRLDILGKHLHIKFNIPN